MLRGRVGGPFLGGLGLQEMIQQRPREFHQHRGVVLTRSRLTQGPRLARVGPRTPEVEPIRCSGT